MSSSLSPGHSVGSGSQPSPGTQPEFGAIIRSISDKRSTQDGNPPKRRGPKPDSKPALTRRQELNRQAQRTHRERKEQYVKSLEEELLRMKNLYSQASQDKDALLEETRHLKSLLMSNGISFSSQQVAGTNTSSNLGSEGFLTASTAFSPAPSQVSSSAAAGSLQGPSPGSARGSGAVDLEQAGIDFVLKYGQSSSSRPYPSPPPQLERPCMAHSHIIDGIVNTAGGSPCGHALMASCAPPARKQDTPFNSRWAPPGSDIQTWDLPKADLARLLDLSSKLELGEEITPVMAWKLVTMDPRILQLGQVDLDDLAEKLSARVRCYGFGAVMEEWEVRDVMNNVTTPRSDAMAF